MRKKPAKCGDKYDNKHFILINSNLLKSVGHFAELRGGQNVKLYFTYFKMDNSSFDKLSFKI